MKTMSHSTNSDTANGLLLQALGNSAVFLKRCKIPQILKMTLGNIQMDIALVSLG